MCPENVTNFFTFRASALLPAGTIVQTKIKKIEQVNYILVFISSGLYSLRNCIGITFYSKFLDWDYPIRPTFPFFPDLVVQHHKVHREQRWKSVWLKVFFGGANINIYLPSSRSGIILLTKALFYEHSTEFLAMLRMGNTRGLISVQHTFE